MYHADYLFFRFSVTLGWLGTLEVTQLRYPFKVFTFIVLGETNQIRTVPKQSLVTLRVS